jgi:hypothetical protein
VYLTFLSIMEKILDNLTSIQLIYFRVESYVTALLSCTVIVSVFVKLVDLRNSKLISSDKEVDKGGGT